VTERPAKRVLDPRHCVTPGFEIWVVEATESDPEYQGTQWRGLEQSYSLTVVEGRAP